MKFLLIVIILPTSAVGSTLSIGSLGIDAVGLRGPNGELLDGMGVGIGQVDPLRPGDPDVDSATFSNSTINPEQVFLQQAAPTADVLGQTPPFDFPIFGATQPMLPA